MERPDGRNATTSTTWGTALGVVLREMVCTVLPEGGQRTARQNAWHAVCADQVHAEMRADVARELETLRGRRARVVGQLSAH